MLDVTGNLKAGSVLCPPEGDAGTGMVAAKCRAPLHRKCLRGHVHLCHGRLGKNACGGASGD